LFADTRGFPFRLGFTHHFDGREVVGCLQGYSFQYFRIPDWVLSCAELYRVRQKYLTVLQSSCEWNRWRGRFVLERSSSETQSISVAMERWSVEHRAFAVEAILKNNDSVVVTQLIFRRHFNIHRNECP